MSATSAIGSELKQAALEAALKSHTLSRSEQLRNLLRYLVREEMEGRQEGLTEYKIGVDGLGLPASFAPGEDSTVRNRTYTLRRKLEDLYRAELPGADVRIEFGKGSYAPQFVAAPSEGGDRPPVAEVAKPLTEPVAALIPRHTGRRHVPWWAGFAGGLAVAGLAVLLWIGRSPSGVDPILREAWGPLLAADANALICVSTTPQMPVRAIPGTWKPLAGEPTLPAPPNVVDWYLKLRPDVAGGRIYLLPTTNSVGLGDALGAAAASRLLAMSGVPHQVMAERLVPLAAMRKRNLVLLAGSADTETAQHLMSKMPFRLQFNGGTGDYALVEQRPGGRVYAAKRSAANRLLETFGLVTVMPSEGSEGQQRTILVVGVYTAGVQGAMDFLTSPEAMRGLREQMGGRFPAGYQVVVRTSMDKMLPLSYRYETHVVTTP